MTATPARIRLVSREVEFATVSDAAVLAARPDAVDGSDQAMPSMFNDTVDALALLTERFVLQKSQRRHEAAEADALTEIGVPVPVAPDMLLVVAVPLAPSLPKVRMVDDTRALDVTMTMRGFAIDYNTDRNSIEADG